MKRPVAIPAMALCIALLYVPVMATAQAATRPKSARPSSAVERLLSQGIEQMRAGDTAGADTTFRKVLAADANNFTAHIYLGALAAQNAEPALAERHFAAAVRLEPMSPEARNNYGAALLAAGKRQLAEKEFAASLRLNPDQPSALVNLAQIKVASGTAEGFAEAAALLQKALRLSPDAEVARALLMIEASTRAPAPQVAEHYAVYSHSVENAPPSVSGLNARRELAAALVTGGYPDQALQEIAAVRAAQPDDQQAVVLEARAHLLRKDVAAAGRLLETQVARGVATAPVYADLADIYERSGHVENAIPVMRRAIELDPKNEGYRVRYGLLLIDTKAPAAAVIRLQEATQEFPKSARIWFALGYAHFIDHKNQEANAAFEKALQLDPKYVPALAYRGMTQAEVGKFEEAQASYRRALALAPNLAPVHYLLAEALVKAESGVQEAERHLQRTLELDAQFARASLALGKLYMRSSRFEQAAELLQRVTVQAPNIAEAWYHLGRVYQRLKQPEKAKETLAVYERLSAQEREAVTAERRELVRRLAEVRF